MDKKQFITFCKKEFETRGFKKIRKTFYLLGRELLCGINLQKSDFSNSFYINYYFFLDKFDDENNYPSRYDLDIYGRIAVMSKTQTINGKHFLTGAIEYEEYTEEELRPFLDRAFEEIILPPVHQGKKYIFDNLGKLYSLSLHKEAVLKKLKS